LKNRQLVDDMAVFIGGKSWGGLCANRSGNSFFSVLLMNGSGLRLISAGRHGIVVARNAADRLQEDK